MKTGFMKKILSMALATGMALSLSSVPALAKETTINVSDGVPLVDIVLSNNLGETTQQVSRQIGDSYVDEEITIHQVAYGSTCTIVPANDYDSMMNGPLFITLSTHNLKGDVLQNSDSGVTSFRLMGNGEFSARTAPYSLSEDTLITAATPAKIVFGKNDSKKIIEIPSNSTAFYEYAPISNIDLSAGYIYKIHITGEYSFINHSANYYFTIKDTSNTSLQTTTATPTKSKVILDSREIAIDTYNINSNNYCKIRDVAQLLNGTGKQFEVVWDKDLQAVSMTSNHAYTSVGGELVKGDGSNKSATLNTAKIYLDGKEVSLTAYTINGNNYIKLRDLGQAFDFGVRFDQMLNAVIIDTSIGYTAGQGETNVSVKN